MNPALSYLQANPLLVVLVLTVVLNFLLLLISLALFFRSKKVLNFYSKMVNVEGESKGKLQEHFEKMATELFYKLLEDYKKSFDLAFNKQAETIGNAAVEQLQGLKGAIHLQSELIAKQGVAMVGEALSEAREEVAKYKQVQLDHVAAEVPKIVDQVSREALSRSIDLSEQKELIWKLLEKAAAEGIFNKGAAAKEARVEVTNVSKVAKVSKVSRAKKKRKKN
ncbi:MAG TPA: hypothetical protein VLE91_02910 [Candidatus Saccharimonadales bacterium]|nr:hypothetical protein [Candidatus Saccharimonadales bacterium]